MDIVLYDTLSICCISSVCVCACVCVQLPQAQQGQTGPASSQPNLLHMPHRQSPLHQASSSSSTSSSSSALSVGQLVSSKCPTQLTKTQHVFRHIEYRTASMLLLLLDMLCIKGPGHIDGKLQSLLHTVALVQFSQATPYWFVSEVSSVLSLVVLSARNDSHKNTKVSFSRFICHFES